MEPFKVKQIVTNRVDNVDAKQPLVVVLVQTVNQDISISLRHWLMNVRDVIVRLVVLIMKLVTKRLVWLNILLSFRYSLSCFKSYFWFMKHSRAYTWVILVIDCLSTLPLEVLSSHFISVEIQRVSFQLSSSGHMGDRAKF